LLARLVGIELELDNEELDVLTRAAELHDIGKMATPDAILYKPAPLDEQELEIMHRHTTIGERILESVPALRPVAAIVRSTHERIDGEGYPDGLAGDQIPRAARIIAVCDAYNAMTTERPYDRTRSRAEALDELRRCAGAQFDPEVVDVFCRVVADERLAAHDPPVDPVEDLAHEPADRLEVVPALLNQNGGDAEAPEDRAGGAKAGGGDR
jgi:HD-GYP domain-containing protein (c-di-GMP phosphodiesterase class II)